MIKEALLVAALVFITQVAFFAQDTEQKSADARRNETITKLETLKISIDFKDATLADIVDFIRELANLNILIDERTNEKLAKDQLEKKDKGDKFTIKLKDVSLKVILKFLLESKGLAITYKEGVLFIVPKEVIEAITIVKMYDVRDMLFKIKGFPGPRMELETIASAARSQKVIVAIPQEEESKPALASEELINTIKTITGEDKWKDDKNTYIEIVGDGILIIRQTVAVHEEIGSVIRSLRQMQ